MRTPAKCDVISKGRIGRGLEARNNVLGDEDGVRWRRCTRRRPQKRGAHTDRVGGLSRPAADSRWDAVVCCFFGRLTGEGMLDRLLPLYRGYLIAVVNTGQVGNIASSGRSHHKKECSGQPAALLKARGAASRWVTAALEFGQQTDSLEDAAAFIRHYAPGCNAAQALVQARERAVRCRMGGIICRTKNS